MLLSRRSYFQEEVVEEEEVTFRIIQYFYSPCISPYFLFQYLDDLKCPVDLSQKLSVVDWLLAHAVRVEYAENGWFNLFS